MRFIEMICLYLGVSWFFLTPQISYAISKIMKRFIIPCLIFLAFVALSGCSTTSLDVKEKGIYTPWYEDGVIPEDCLLQEGEEPEILVSDDPLTDIRLLQSRYWLVLGDFLYDGIPDSSLGEEAKALCLRERALIGVFCYQNSDSSSGFGSSVYPNLYSIYLLVPMPDYAITECMRIGLKCSDLTISESISTKRNTGAMVHMVYFESPAYYSNIFAGDVITEINGIPVTNSSDYNALVDNFDSSQEMEITYYRDGVPYKTSLTPLY